MVNDRLHRTPLNKDRDSWMTEPIEGRNQRRILLLALVIVMCVGAALRIVKLGSESLWLDEAYSIFTSRLPLPAIVQETSKDVHPPLYYFLLHYWMKAFGESEFSARLLSVVFGVAAIPLLYRLASMLFDRTTGLFSAMLLAWSHFNIEFSQEARMYSLLVLLSLGSLYFFLKLLKSDAGSLTVAGYIVCTTLLMYTQVYSVFVIAAENLYFLLLFFSSRDIFRRTLWRWLLTQTTVFLLFAPWLVVLSQQIREHQSFWIRPPTLFELRYAFLQIAGSYQLFFLLVPLAALPVACSVLEKLSKAHTPIVEKEQSELPLSTNERVFFGFVWLACPVLLPFIASYFVTPFFLAKYTICASLGFIVLAARGLRMIPWRIVSVGLLVAFVVLAQSDLNDYWKTPRKDRWREAMAFFNQTAQPNDLVVFTEPAAHQAFEYYATHRDVIEQPFPLYNNEFNADTVAGVLKPVVDDHQRVWLVLSHQIDKCALVTKQMSEWYVVREHRTEPGVELYLYQQKK
jgi:mannosyltransferase